MFTKLWAGVFDIPSLTNNYLSMYGNTEIYKYLLNLENNAQNFQTVTQQIINEIMTSINTLLVQNFAVNYDDVYKICLNICLILV